MKTAGVIAEYNPFHNGHKYQLGEIRKRTGADYIIVAMSGDFVQRGTPAILDKYTRAEMALRAGADLVLELPFLYATATAELFACGGVSLLKAAGIVDCLCFGTETEDITSLLELADLLNEEPESYKSRLRQLLGEGLSFPAAREKALVHSLSAAGTYNKEKADSYLQELLGGSNNILALEYLRQLRRNEGSTMEPVAIPRKGDAYTSDVIETEFASATAIRGSLRSDQKLKFGLLEVLPDASIMPVLMAKNENRLLYEDSLSPALAFRLTSLRYQPECAYADCGGELLNRLVKMAGEYESYEQFCRLVKTRNVTYSHVSHALLNILFGITEQDTSEARKGVPYLRVLGFRKSSAALLKEITQRAEVPVITRPADAEKVLDERARRIFAKDLYASDVYNQLVFMQSGVKIRNDYSHEMVFV